MLLTRTTSGLPSRLFRPADGEPSVMNDYATILARWPVPYDGRFVPTRHGRTWLLSSGEPAAPDDAGRSRWPR